jgi:hypothetical protein
MKKTILILLGFCTVLTVSAQKKKDNQSANGEITKKAIIQSDLTNEQREKLTKINRQFKKLREQIERDTTLNAETMKLKIKELQLEKQKKMRAVLTDMQWIDFEKKRDSLKVSPKAQ